MSDPTVPISAEFFEIIDRVQDNAVSDLDRRLNEQRDFAKQARLTEGSKAIDLRALLNVSDEEAKAAALEDLHAKMLKEANEAAAKKENTNVPSEERFPAPPVTE